ncbi:MAG: sterol desaturase family protein [Gammaproteobacteria bacterium]|nr:sterol desaturase family protein [Gammaproteobacteria bacterium]
MTQVEDATRRFEYYQPAEKVEPPPIYRWPIKPSRIARWFVAEFLYPSGLFFIGLAVFAWHYLTPDISRMATVEPGWVALLWLRNAGLLLLVAGGLHWRLHMRRAQGKKYKFDKRWLAKNSRRFLFRDQVKDNMFWSVVSGVTIWTAYEAATVWAYASGTVASTRWSEAPVYLGAMLIATFFWSALHFEIAHRPLHWRPVYRLCHALHHKNVNTGPWSGISMHPLEHLLYFTVFLLWWIVPADPIVITLTGFFQGLSPAVSHCGFQKVRFGRLWLAAGTHFHTLHHQLFDVNFGHVSTPTDKLFGTWFDGTDEAYEKLGRRGLM